MAIEYPSYEAATGKPVYSPDNGKPAKDCGGAVDHCTDCNSNQDATATGGATPFDWGNVCTWMDNSTWGGTAFSDVGTSCMWTMIQNTPSPQGAVAFVKKTEATGLWDVWIVDGSANTIYSASGLAAGTFTCVAGVLAGTATLTGVGSCAGSPTVAFTVG